MGRFTAEYSRNAGRQRSNPGAILPASRRAAAGLSSRAALRLLAVNYVAEVSLESGRHTTSAVAAHRRHCLMKGRTWRMPCGSSNSPRRSTPPPAGCNRSFRPSVQTVGSCPSGGCLLVGDLCEDHASFTTIRIGISDRTRLANSRCAFARSFCQTAEYRAAAA